MRRGGPEDHAQLNCNGVANILQGILSAEAGTCAATAVHLARPQGHRLANGYHFVCFWQILLDLAEPARLHMDFQTPGK